ncbi:MAG: hypothetical protein H0V65_06805 [Chitinophagales bacterium]|jgi:plastocyanin|nr:hypothetical protein [Chitinophagales bacterium]
MKRLIRRYTLLISALIFLSLSHSKGASFTITVGDFQFSPDTLTNVNIGDTIQWIWLDGLHTTTSNGIPAGATPWNEILDSMNITFTYVITIPGTYYYISVPDLPSMQGQFTVNSLIGISSLVNEQFDFSVFPNIISNKFAIRFSLNETVPVEVLLSDVSGKWKKILLNKTIAPGYHDEFFCLSEDISSGIYLITVRYKNMLLTKRIMIIE